MNPFSLLVVTNKLSNHSFEWSSYSFFVIGIGMGVGVAVGVGVGGGVGIDGAGNEL